MLLEAPSASHAATVDTDTFETTPFKDQFGAGNYVNTTDDGKWVEAGGGDYGVGNTNSPPDSGAFSTGKEMRVGYDGELYGAGNPTADMTLTTTWNATKSHTFTFSYRSFDGDAGAPNGAGGGADGNFFFGYRNPAGTITFLTDSASSAITSLSANGWSTFTTTITSAELTTAGANGNRIFMRIDKRGNGGGTQQD